MRRRCVLALLVLLGVAAASAAGSSVAAPRQTAAAQPQLSVAPAVAAPGRTLVLRGRGFPRNARIALLAGRPRSEAQRIGGARTGRRGAFTARIRIRERSSAGTYVALACYDACRVKATARFRIAAR